MTLALISVVLFMITVLFKCKLARAGRFELPPFGVYFQRVAALPNSPTPQNTLNPIILAFLDVTYMKCVTHLAFVHPKAVRIIPSS